MDLRARFHHARIHYEQGLLAEAAEVADEGIRLAVETGLKWSTYGTDLRFLRFLIHYVAGEWDQAESVAAGFGARVGTAPEATLSSFALFIEVARGLPAVEDRLSWLRPFWHDALVAYISRGLAAEHALWQGDPATALDHVHATLATLDPGESGTIRIAAIGLWAMADLGITEGADDLLSRARFALTTGPVGEGGQLGPEGQAWALRLEAEWHRVHGRLDPDLWREVVDGLLVRIRLRGGAEPAGASRRPCWPPATGRPRRPSGSTPESRPESYERPPSKRPWPSSADEPASAPATPRAASRPGK